MLSIMTSQSVWWTICIAWVGWVVLAKTSAGPKVGNIWVFSPLVSVKMRDSSAFSVCILFEKSVFIFQFLNIKMHNYVSFDMIVHFIIQKLTDKHTFHKLYKLRKLSSLAERFLSFLSLYTFWGKCVCFNF